MGRKCIERVEAQQWTAQANRNEAEHKAAHEHKTNEWLKGIPGAGMGAAVMSKETQYGKPWGVITEDDQMYKVLKSPYTPMERAQDACKAEAPADMAKAIDHERNYGERWHGMLHQIAAVLELPEGYSITRDIMPEIKRLQGRIAVLVQQRAAQDWALQAAEKKLGTPADAEWGCAELNKIGHAVGIDDELKASAIFIVPAIKSMQAEIADLKQQINAGDEMVTTMDRLGLLRSHQDPLGQRPIEALERIRKELDEPREIMEALAKAIRLEEGMEFSAMVPELERHFEYADRMTQFFMDVARAVGTPTDTMHADEVLPAIEALKLQETAAEVYKAGIEEAWKALRAEFGKDIGGMPLAQMITVAFKAQAQNAKRQDGPCSTMHGDDK